MAGGDTGATPDKGGVDTQDFIDELAKWLGTPYLWGGDAPGGFDCSGLVNYSAGQMGIAIPRTSQEQWQKLPHVNMAQIQPGDVLFQAGSDGTDQAPGHELVYIGHGMVIEAAHTGTNVEVVPLSSIGPVVGAARIPTMTYSGAPTDLTKIVSSVQQSGGAVAASGMAAATPGGQGGAGTVDGMSGAQTQALGQHVEQVLGAQSTYTGPGAYKGFDVSEFEGDAGLMAQAKHAIDVLEANPNLERTVFAQAYQQYGSDLWMASDPQIRTLLVAGAINGWALDQNMFLSLLQKTNWWTTHDANQRNFQELIHTEGGVNSASVKQLVDQAEARITNIANTLGVQLTGAQLKNFAWKVASESATPQGQFSATAFSDQEITRMVAGAFKATTFLQQTGTQTQTGQAGAQNPQGDAATLFNQFKTITKNYLLPMSDKQIAAQVQRYISSDTGEPNFQAGAISGFTTFAANQAKALYPALASVLGTTSTIGTDNTPYAALANYRSLIATYTGYQGDPDTINMLDPKYAWILTGQGAPATPANSAAGSPAYTPPPPSSSSSTPTLPTYDTVQRYLMSQPQFQSTDQAKNMGWQVAHAITTSFGYA